MKSFISISPDSFVLVKNFTDSLAELLKQSGKKNKEIYIALSGGNTPRMWFSHLADNSTELNWSQVHLFWGDERCVPPDHPESNFGMTKKYLLDKINIPGQNIHRIHGENDPAREVIRYSNEITRIIKTTRQLWPVFDWIILGLGADGHTASLFPGSRSLAVSDKICTTAEHPQSGQKRITLTLPVLNHTRRISFMISGKSKAPIAAQIIKGKADSIYLPAARIQPIKGRLEWFLDAQAAELLF